MDRACGPAGPPGRAPPNSSPRPSRPSTVTSGETEQRLADRQDFLWADESPDRARRVKAGEVLVRAVPRQGREARPQRPDSRLGGQRFHPRRDLERTLAMVQDYDHHKDVYKPEVIDSRVISRNGNDFQIYLRLLKKKVITVVLNSEHDVKYTPVGQDRWRSVSRTTKIAEVENAGKKDEREKPPGTGEGFLWRLNSYWRFEERDGGVWLECQAISLTRDVPTGLGWIVSRSSAICQERAWKTPCAPPAPR